jgi:hypothetical protein
MSQLLEVLHRLHALAAHPLALVVVLALLVALLEQRLTRRRTPDFSLAYRDIAAKPPPSKPLDRP